RTLENRLEKLRRKKVSVTEVLDSYYIPEMIRGNDSEVVLSKNPKQVGNELDLDVALEDLIDGYLEELQNL
ncbi:365_t:CDS:1, partial [Gigaspora margarita]